MAFSFIDEVNEGQISVKLVEDSCNDIKESRLTTFLLTYPRFIHSELMTHRVFSRNSSSSRAIKVERFIAQVLDNPAVPIHIGKQQPGMQAENEVDDKERVLDVWNSTSRIVAAQASILNDMGVHKQVANRILEPFQLISVVVTATEFGNWFRLRNHKDAQPEIQKLAQLMYFVYNTNSPRLLNEGEWHLPFITKEERSEYDIETLLRVSTARCARTSYLGFNGEKLSVDADSKLYDKLVGDMPHYSALEHQGKPITVTVDRPSDLLLEENTQGATHMDVYGNIWSGNFREWVQYRQLVQKQYNDTFMTCVREEV